ncbi:uncharacterized protein BX664DRAFT_341693 [Halteromyces radiatus]|uniref:uncharacterized protein n=1 Tax=Halteromyces radiatus TaxID=101107 RepID=UPI00221E4466|nr:uncharacterized protein BX664DRAFT_341693 [Halteromyces radiatus]KAI8079883.1 hypothetical protein BX664DRAFT_341693 [Halteromyces radiatus]
MLTFTSLFILFSLITRVFARKNVTMPKNQDQILIDGNYTSGYYCVKDPEGHNVQTIEGDDMLLYRTDTDSNNVYLMCSDSVPDYGNEELCAQLENGKIKLISDPTSYSDFRFVDQGCGCSECATYIAAQDWDYEASVFAGINCGNNGPCDYVDDQEENGEFYVYGGRDGFAQISLLAFSPCTDGTTTMNNFYFKDGDYILQACDDGMSKDASFCVAELSSVSSTTDWYFKKSPDAKYDNVACA